MPTYSSKEFATILGNPTLVSMLAPTRDTWLCPASVTTGSPIQSESQVVVVPLNGKGSSAMSALWCNARNSRDGNLPHNSSRDDSMPLHAKRSRIRCPARPPATLAITSRAPGTAARILDQTCTTCGVILDNALNDPKVTFPCFDAGKSLTAGPSSGGRNTI